ncbi:MAG: DNA mismatch repair protein MutS [Bacteroidales bacterium]|nr:DNA mismatch repair protein MutS [Bacteroidales bacterium]
MPKNKEFDSPLMKQYAELKRKYPDALLLFRVGDFYETFGNDAQRASQVLGITLTRKMAGGGEYTELAGIPYHALEQYLPRLVRAGMRVAICEQLEDPKTTKGLVKRGITELVTPGVVYNDMVLERKENNFLCGLHLTDRINGISFLDVSTGEFFVSQGDLAHIDQLLTKFKPSEVILQRKRMHWFQDRFSEKYYCNVFDDWVFAIDYARGLLLKQFGTKSLKGFGIEDLEEGIIAACALIHYLNETQHDRTANICAINRVEQEHYVWLDKFTIRNLELVSSPHENGHTLLDVLDHTLTPMGARNLRRWLLMPLKDASAIEERLRIVDYLLKEPDLCDKLKMHVKEVGDLERLITKVAVGRVNPREMIQIGRSLQAVSQIKHICSSKTAPSQLLTLAEQLNPCTILIEQISREIAPDPPVKTDKGGVIADGVDPQLDQLRQMAGSGKDYLAQIQRRESERTNIPSLKIGFNNVYGYYLEVSNTHKEKVPSEWIRRQTLTNAERYITPELKEYEEKILGAEERILSLELRLFSQLVEHLAQFIKPIQHNAHIIATIDTLMSFARTAISNNYCRPQFTNTHSLTIKEGRHPVIEAQMSAEEQYVSNDIALNQDQQIVIITGPNMSGKSALLRQTALIAIMAQMGCYCPAQKVEIHPFDKIFTRVGASDNLSAGESTFMVEMNETANILNNITSDSLVLLDEIGRGTSTYDGISIAWAITEYLHNNKKAQPKVLFATHYHELIDMADKFPRIANYHVDVKEINEKIIFLRKLVPGGSEHSFGIHVARLAGMPPQVLNRADTMLQKLEENNKTAKVQKGIGRKKDIAVSPLDGLQLSFIQLDDPTLYEIRERILDIDINTLTPLEALMKLNEIKKLVTKK